MPRLWPILAGYRPMTIILSLICRLVYIAFYVFQTWHDVSEC